MDSFVKFLDEKLSVPMIKLANQRHLLAIRNGMMAVMPLIIVGSFFLIIAEPPLPSSWGLTQFLVANGNVIKMPYRMTMMIITLYATFGIGTDLAKSYKLDGMTGGIFSVMAFLLTMVPVNVDPTLEAGVAGWVLPMGNLGGGSMFVGIIVSIIAVEVYRFMDTKGIKIKMPEQVPTAVARSFESLLPLAVVMVGIGAISYWFNFSWHAVIGSIIQPLVNAADTLGSSLLIVFLTTFLWAFGIHGAQIVNTVARPIWVTLLDTNAALQDAGQPLTAIAAEPFFNWFVWIGGAGATLGLVICMFLFSRSTYSKSLGRSAFLPVLFNINEPLMFGAPIVMNPILIIPFIIAPVVNTVVAWAATSLGLINHVIAIPSWTLPAPIGAFLATKDFRAVILSLVLILISVIIYFPFFKMYDNKLVLEEKAQAEENNS